MKSRLFALVSLILLGLPLSANAIVRRYTLKQEFPKGTLEKELNVYMQVEVDLWHGENETVLIAAGYSLSTFDISVDRLWSKRKMLSSDVVHFSRTEDSYLVELNDTFDSENSILISIEKDNEFMARVVVVPGHLPVTPAADVVVKRIYELEYKPSNLTREKVAVEEDNRPVGFDEFFANKSTMFEISSSVYKLTELEPDLFHYPIKKLSKRQRKKEEARLRSLHAEKSWIGSSNYKKPYISGLYKPEEIKVKGFDKQIDALVAMDAKPRIGDVIALMKEIREAQPEYDLNKNPFLDFLRRGEEGVHRAMKQIPELVEKLETAFPEATWYLLGRDVYLLNDAMEAYYLSIGQTGRVIRLPASQPSFKNATLSTVDGFLKSNGINVDEITAESKPQIILDISSYSNGIYRLSQSRHLMRAAYDRWSNDLGRNPKDLTSKVNFVNVSLSHSHTDYKTAEDVAAFLKDLKFEPEPEKILSAYAPGDFLYTDAWHGLYERFENKNGQIVTGHESASSRSQKLTLLAEMWAIVSHFGVDSLIGSCERALEDKK